MQANVAAGVQVAAVQQQVTAGDRRDGPRQRHRAGSWPARTRNSDEAGAFLSKAFGAAIFLIFLVLLAQFNSSPASWLVLSCVVMATIGVFLGLMVMGQAFGIVMSGIGVIALAGVVVNNNIVLIDTYDRLRRRRRGTIEEAVLQTCRERARPVRADRRRPPSSACCRSPSASRLELPTSETTIGAPSTQWWISLSSAIVFGLAFATVLTLVVTPASLAAIAHVGNFFGRFRRKKRPALATMAPPAE